MSLPRREPTLGEIVAEAEEVVERVFDLGQPLYEVSQQMGLSRNQVQRALYAYRVLYRQSVRIFDGARQPKKQLASRSKRVAAVEPPPGLRLLEKRHAMWLLNVSLGTLDNIVKRGELRIIRQGRSVRIPRDELDRYENRLRARSGISPRRSKD